MLIDSHAHLLSLENPDDAVLRAEAEGVGKIISIGTGVESSLDTIEFSKKYSGVYASVGIHPHSASDFSAEATVEMERMLADPKVVALGETGLDYHYMNSPKEDQIKSFEAHVELAKKYSLPFVVHVRDAHRELIDMLCGMELGEKPGVIHCFSGDYQTAKEYLCLDFFISFSGMVTFNRSAELRDVALKIPAEKILFETDSPYLSPVPHRGKPNEPRNVVYVAKQISELRGLSLEEFSGIVSENATELFGKIPNDGKGLV